MHAQQMAKQFETDSLVKDGTLYLRVHKKNLQFLRGIRNYTNLADSFIWYVNEFCKLVQHAQRIAIPEDREGISTNEFPITSKYIEKYYGERAQKELLDRIKAFRAKATNYDAASQAITQGICKGIDDDKIKEMEVRKKSDEKEPNRFKDLFDHEEVTRFFSPGRPSLDIGGR